MPIHAFSRELPARPVAAVNGKSRRQVRYAQDTTYREKAKDASRRSYRKQAGLELESCLYSLEFLNKAAKLTMVILPSGREMQMLVLSIPKTADMLQSLYQTIWRWIDNGIIPAPILSIPLTKRMYPVYHVEEVRILVEEIGQHMRTLKYLRKDHTEVRRRIERRILACRKSLKIKR